MSTYLWLNCLILVFPLLLSLTPRYRSFYRHWRALISSILAVGSLFIFWDILVTRAGHWSFNPNHVLGNQLLFLPLEEWLFFVTVPFSCLFLYQALKDRFNQCPSKPVVKSVAFISAVVLFILALWVYPHPYSAIVLAFTGIVVLLVVLLLPALFHSHAYWLYLTLGTCLFFIFNSVLTSLPIVAYDPGVILNLRLGTVPIEDFFYNWSLLTLYALIYDLKA